MPLEVEVHLDAFERVCADVRRALQSDPSTARETLTQLIDGRVKVHPGAEQGYRLEWYPCWHWLVAGTGFEPATFGL